MANKISFYRGDTPLINVTIPIAGDLITGNPADYEASFTLTTNIDPTTDGDAAIQKDATPTATATTWLVSFQLLNSETQNLDPTIPYYYDVQLRKTDNTFVGTLIAGICIVKTDYTRRVS